jgi:hypothetical protein
MKIIYYDQQRTTHCIIIVIHITYNSNVLAKNNIFGTDVTSHERRKNDMHYVFLRESQDCQDPIIAPRKQIFLPTIFVRHLGA